jgi:hypothetical protein
LAWKGVSALREGRVAVFSPPPPTPPHPPPPPRAPVSISHDSNVLRGGGATRGDRTTRRGKQEGGRMRGKVTTSWRIERRWWQQGDAKTSQGKQKGCASRGGVDNKLVP